MGDWIQENLCWNFGRLMDPNNLVVDKQILELTDLVTDIQPFLDNFDEFIWWKDKPGYIVHNSYTMLLSFFGI